MAAVTSAGAVSLSLLLIFLSSSHACKPLNFRQLKEACDKAPHPGYCLGLIKARHDDEYSIWSPNDMAAYLMNIAGDIGHELATLARAELPKGGARRRRCVEKWAAGFDAAASKLDAVDGKLVDNSRETFDPVYRFVQSNAGALAANWNACPGTGVMVAKQKHFAMLLDIVLVLGKLPDPPCFAAPTTSPSL